MPAKAPPIGEILAARLVAIGSRLHAHRKQHKVTATSAAEAAGISRATLHRIERGEPSVTMGAYLSAIAALGLELEVADPPTGRAFERQPGVPASIRLDAYAAESGTRDRLVSEVTRLRSVRLGEPLPIEADSLRTYDNGQAQIYHLRPRTQYQR